MLHGISTKEGFKLSKGSGTGKSDIDCTFVSLAAACTEFRLTEGAVVNRNGSKAQDFDIPDQPF